MTAFHLQVYAGECALNNNLDVALSSTNKSVLIDQAPLFNIANVAGTK
jgi:hypothetical protein